METNQSRTAQASVDMDASRLVLLDRAENGDHAADDGDGNIPVPRQR